MMKKIFLISSAIMALSLSLAIGYYLIKDTPEQTVTNANSLVNRTVSQPVNSNAKNNTTGNLNAASLTNDTSFVAPTGAGDHAGTEGPWARRILGAYSDDGLTWTKTGEVITDQADVPSLAIDDEGTLYMYYYGWTVGTKQNVPAVAISEDNGAAWSFHYLQFSGYPGRGDVGDPDVMYDEGVFRMYGTTRDGGNAHILYGTGTSYNNFTYSGVAFEPENVDAGVASVYQTADGWHLLSLASLGLASREDVGKHWYATSVDGKTFTEQDSTYFTVDNAKFFNGNVIPADDGYRMYLFSGVDRSIRSWFSTDGENWELESGKRLSLESDSGLEAGYVGDPDVIQLPDGRYFMAYATLIP